MGTAFIKSAIVCVFKTGGLYTPEWVLKWEKMIRNFIPENTDVVCLTDYQPKTLWECERWKNIITVPLSRNLPGYWSKIELFEPNVFVGYQKVLYLDLDVLVFQPLAPFYEFTKDFAIAPVKHYNEKNPKRCIGYQSSVMCFRPNTRHNFYNKFSFGDMEKWYGDQDYIKALSGNEDTFPEGWVLKTDKIPDWNKETPPEKVKVALCINPKNDKLIEEGYECVTDLW